MKIRLRVLAALVFACILLFFVALVLPSLVRFRPDALVAWMEEEIGRPVSISQARLNLFPGPSLLLHNVTVANREGYGEEPLFQSRSITLRLRILPLLWRRFVITRITVHDPVLSVVEAADGTSNLDGIGGEKERKEREARPPPPRREEPAKRRKPRSRRFQTEVRSVELRGGRLRLLEASPLRKLNLVGLSGTVRGITSEPPWNLSFDLMGTPKGGKPHSFRVRGSLETAADAADPLEGHLEAVLRLHRFDISSLAPYAGRRLGDLHGEADASLKLSGDPTGELSAEGDVVLTSVLFGRKRLFHPGPIAVEPSVEIDSEGKSVRILDTPVRFGSSALRVSGLVRFPEEKSVDLHVTSGALLLEDLRPFFSSLQKDVRLEGSLVLDASLEGSVDRSDYWLKGGVHPEKEIALRVPGRSSPWLFAGDVKFLGKVMELKEGRIRSGESTLRLGGKMWGFRNPDIDFSLNSRSVRLEDFLPDAEPVRKAGGKSSRRRQTPLLRPVAFRTERGVPVSLDRVKARGRIRFDRFSWRRWTCTDLTASFQFHESQGWLKDISLAAFGGAFRGKASGSFDRPSAEWFASGEVSSFRLGKMARALDGDEIPVRGILSGEFSLQAAGRVPWEVRESLKGNGRARVERGALTNLNLVREAFSGMIDKFGISKDPEKLMGKRLARKNRLDFEDLSFEASVGNEKVYMKDLSIASQGNEIAANGSVGFDGELNFRGDVTLSDELTERLVHSIREVEKIMVNEEGRAVVPVRVTGTVEDPRPFPDVNRIFGPGLGKLLDIFQEIIEDKLEERDGLH